MLGRVLKNSGLLSRSFSGGHDPYMLHLKQEPDKYPQYAHLHWHTTNPLEVGKYAKLRSKAELGSHVTEDPEPIDWLPAVDNLNKMNVHVRNDFFRTVIQCEHRIIWDLESQMDYRVTNFYSLMDVLRDEVMAMIKPKQMEACVAHVKTLIAEYQAAGVPVTRDKMHEHASNFLLSQFGADQGGHMLEAAKDKFARVGLTNPMNDNN